MDMKWAGTTFRSLVLVAALMSLASCNSAPAMQAPKDTAPATPSSRAEIFARLGDTFVASKPYPTGAMALYTQPKPYAGWLCRVDRVTLPEWIVEGRPKTESEFFDDDIELDRLFGVWRSPSEGKEDDRDAACAKFRDFDNLFHEDAKGGESRFIFLLDRLLRDLAAGKTRYPIECIDRRGSRAGKPCDAKAIASGLSIKRLGSGQTESERETADSFLRTDRLHFRIGDTHGHPVIVALLIDSEEKFGTKGDGDIRAARFEVEII
jgi:hypothetical protein